MYMVTCTFYAAFKKSCEMYFLMLRLPILECHRQSTRGTETTNLHLYSMMTKGKTFNPWKLRCEF
jgi:hypothetical protein